MGKSEVNQRNPQKVSWWSKSQPGRHESTRGQLAQGPIGLVKFGVFNLTAMASHCRILDKGYGILSVALKKNLSSFSPITLETSYLVQSPYSI